MQTRLHPEIINTDAGRAADKILRSCVHCGFCNSTCPTYQLLGDELDGPRGRIYLIKEMLETGQVAEGVPTHIDRCLTCRACETTCPSGVEYGQLVDIGRDFMRSRRQLPLRRRLLSFLLRQLVPEPKRFGFLLGIGQSMRGLLPAALKAHVPPSAEPIAVKVPTLPAQRVLVLQGCVQRSATPNVNRALTNLLAQHDVAVEMIDEEGCCGALDYHLGEHEAGRSRMRALIDRLLPRLDDVSAIVSTASGCGVTVKDYVEIFADDAVYADRAKRVADACIDASELLAEMDFTAKPLRVACHVPCTMQHGQKLPGFLPILQRAGLVVTATSESHLCCGSAGTYSILEPALSTQLRDRKRLALSVDEPDVIATANVGCQLHLDGGDVPVKHWLELLAEQVSLLEQPPQ